MTTPVRAIYENGVLKLLDPVELDEGELVNLSIESQNSAVRAALADLLIQMPESESIDENALMEEIESGTRGIQPVSEAIIEERRGLIACDLNY